jgi:hypothetical protein
MKKCELFSVFDEQAEQIRNVEALASVIQVGIGGEVIAERHLKQCMRLMCGLTEQLKLNQVFISRGLTELYIVNDAVNSNSD